MIILVTGRIQDESGPEKHNRTVFWAGLLALVLVIGVSCGIGVGFLIPEEAGKSKSIPKFQKTLLWCSGKLISYYSAPGHIVLF